MVAELTAPLILLSLYFVAELIPMRSLDASRYILIGGAVGNLIGVLVRWINKYTIFQFQIIDKKLQLSTISFYGNFKETTIEIPSIEKVRYCKRNMWRRSDTLRLYVSNETLDYYVENDVEGKKALENLEISFV